MKKWNMGHSGRLGAAVVLMAVISLLSLSGCASKSANTSARAETAAAARYVETAGAGQYMEALPEEDAGTEMQESGSGISSTADMGSLADAGRKLIRDVSMNVEARDFDGVLSQITGKVRELGGYVESSDVSGISVSSYGGSQQRYADIKARIPADKLDRFVESVEGAGNVTS